MFKFTTHLELIFVYGVRKGSSFILFSFRYLIILASFNEKTVISPFVLEHFLCHISYQYKHDSILGIPILFPGSIYL